MIALLLAAALLGKPVDIEMKPFTGIDSRLQVGCSVMTSGYTLVGPKGFGGYSGIDLDPETGALTLLSDAGHLLTATARLRPDGSIRKLTEATRHKIVRPDDGRRRNDTEGLEPRGEGWLVTREGHQDAIEIGWQDGEAVQLRRLTDFKAVGTFPINGSFEAVASIADDLHLLIPEEQNRSRQTPIIAWREGEDPRRIAVYQGEEEYDVTDLAADIEGDRLFILERAFSRAKGPRANIKVLRLSDIRAARDGDVLKPRRLARLGFFEGADNMEGIDYYRAEDGGEMLVLVSDDNFNDVQRTVLMTLRLGPNCALSPAETGPGPDQPAE